MTQTPVTRQAKECAELSTIHGVPLIAASRSIVGRLFWLLVVCAAMAAVIYEITHLVVNYLATPSYTDFELKKMAEMEMPQVTLCLLRRFNDTKLLQSLGVDEKEPNAYQLAEYFDAAFFTSYTTAVYNRRYVAKLLNASASDGPVGRKILELNRMPKRDLFNILQNSSLDCEQLFNSETSLIDERLPFCDMFEEHLAQNGQCFSLVPKLIKQSLEGPIGGLTLTYYDPQLQLKSQVNTFFEHAIHVFVSTNSAITQELPVVVALGTHTHIAIRAENYVSEAQSRTCWDRDKPAALKYFPAYGFRKCQFECMLTVLDVRCGCIPLNTFIETNISIDAFCHPTELSACLTNLTAVQIEREISFCREHRCPLSCNYWTYKPLISYGPITVADLPAASKDLGGHETVIDIYFSAIQYTLITEYETLTYDVVLANIGGSLGFFTGGSVISIIHLVASMIALFVTSIRNAVRAKQQ